jgi:hypothetical protein
MESLRAVGMIEVSLTSAVMHLQGRKLARPCHSML